MGDAVLARYGISASHIVRAVSGMLHDSG